MADECAALCCNGGKEEVVAEDEQKIKSIIPAQALSYVWGPQHPRRLIELDGKPCEVGENLYQALVHLRPQSESRLLWVDALCINQLDLDERNHQVAQMGNIYSQAARVVTWLGLSDAKTSEAIRFLQIAHTPERFSWNYVRGAAISVRHLFGLPYWKRLWIVQEVLMANDLTFVCGKQTFSMHHIKNFLESMDPIKTHPLAFLQNSNPARLLRDYQSFAKTDPARLESDYNVRFHVPGRQTPSLSLMGLCLCYGDSLCEDNRDRIFGLHQLMKYCCRKANPIDYQKSAYAIYHSALKHHITMHVSGIAWDERDENYEIRKYESFHRALGITPANILEFGVASDPEPETPDVMIVGQLNSRIAFVSRPLDSRNTCTTRKFPRRSQIPPLPIRNRAILQLCYKTYSDTFSSQGSQGVTRELDLVCSLAQTTSYSSASYNTSTVHHESDHFEGKLHKFKDWLLPTNIKKDGKTSPQLFYQSLHQAQLRAVGFNCRIAVSSTGVMYFVPPQTEVRKAFSCGATKHGIEKSSPSSWRLAAQSLDLQP
ncbi:Heterokaryon incompatibility protein 6 OR allele [Lachnellula suecica]|uniref:Heterokaryon incompatibility protein 6 OR allele n=1 Tax=Lachnellula suecica TaxID=602035 RepID=A0A8T9C1G3_9HELO|nr:Heterokaryon incompatibility protein 6 OR allele [Lachnellula suecica]